MARSWLRQLLTLRTAPCKVGRQPAAAREGILENARQPRGRKRVAYGPGVEEVDARLAPKAKPAAVDIEVIKHDARLGALGYLPTKRGLGIRGSDAAGGCQSRAGLRGWSVAPT